MRPTSKSAVHAEKVQRELTVDVVELVFVFAIVFCKVLLINLFEVAEIIGAFGIDTPDASRQPRTLPAQDLAGSERPLQHLHLPPADRAVAVSNELESFRQLRKPPERHAHGEDAGADWSLLKNWEKTLPSKSHRSSDLPTTMPSPRNTARLNR